ncbi:MAG: NUDIX hydrolase [Clostridiales bacterium]|nr:NUDIX hydrolase [Clostridiales bacterium]
MALLKDKNGKTEAEFLREYDVGEYFRPSVTVDAILYRANGKKLSVLMIERGGHPFIGKYAFAGGFVEKDESCETAAARELFEETGVKAVSLRQLVTVSTPERDPRWRNITVVFCGSAPSNLAVQAGDDAAAASWFDVEYSADGTLRMKSEVAEFTCKLDIARDVFGRIDLNKTKIIERGETAFDHAKVVCYLAEALNRGELCE